eukprot:6186125-Pleurochrysis_carterae.AAC.1
MAFRRGAEQGRVVGVHCMLAGLRRGGIKRRVKAKQAQAKGQEGETERGCEDASDGKASAKATGTERARKAGREARMEEVVASCAGLHGGGGDGR